jgi:large subunit ribosomal protein L13
MTTTYLAKKADLDRRWFVVDATDKVLGRLATKIARVLIGKHKPTYTPHLDGGDFVVVTNAQKVKLTGTKLDTKMYDWVTHSQSGQSSMPGGHRYRSAREQMKRDPRRVIELAVKRMMPKTKLGRRQITKLKIYSGTEHPHASQKPETLDLTKI